MNLHVPGAPPPSRAAALVCASVLACASPGLPACKDTTAVQATRAQAEQACRCEQASTHHAYKTCVAGVVDAAVGAGTLPASCKIAIARCAAHSTCGRPGAVTCCTIRRGATRCRVRRVSDACTARGGTVGRCSSCCDACGTGGCPGTTGPPTTTTTTTLPPHRSDHSIQVGPGFSDVSPHQVVRTSTNVLYALVPTCDSYPSCPGNTLKAYRAGQAGTPTSFSEQDAGHAPSGGIGVSATAIDGGDLIHVLWNVRSGSGSVRYATFSTATNAWGATATLETTNWTSFGQGDEGVALALDSSGTPHAAWTVQGSDGLHIHYANRTGGTWSSPVGADDVALATNHNAWHPTLAFTPAGDLFLAWLDGSTNYTADGTIHVRTRHAGTFGASIQINDQAMTAIDNGPSLLVTSDGVQHLTFCNYNNEIRYWYNSGSGWRGDQQPATQQTHDPSLGPDGAGGVYIYGHGTPQGGLSGHGDNLYRFHKPPSGTWGPWTLYATGSFDSSVSTRWAQFFHAFPATLDVVYWGDAYPNVLFAGVD